LVYRKGNQRGPNGLLMNVRKAIEFVQANPPEINLPESAEGKHLADSHDSAAMEWVASYLNDTYCWNKHFGWLGYKEGVWEERTDENLREAVRRIIHKFWEDARKDPNLQSTLPP